MGWWRKDFWGLDFLNQADKKLDSLQLLVGEQRAGTCYVLIIMMWLCFTFSILFQLAHSWYKQFSLCNVKLLMKKVLITSKQRKLARGAKLQQLHNGPRGEKSSSLIETTAWKSAFYKEREKLCQSGVHRTKSLSWSTARGSHPEQTFSTIHRMSPLALV